MHQAGKPGLDPASQGSTCRRSCNSPQHGRASLDEVVALPTHGRHSIVSSVCDSLSRNVSRHPYTACLSVSSMAIASNTGGRNGSRGS